MMNRISIVLFVIAFLCPSYINITTNRGFMVHAPPVRFIHQPLIRTPPPESVRLAKTSKIYRIAPVRDPRSTQSIAENDKVQQHQSIADSPAFNKKKISKTKNYVQQRLLPYRDSTRFAMYQTKEDPDVLLKVYHYPITEPKLLNSQIEALKRTNQFIGRGDDQNIHVLAIKNVQGKTLFESYQQAPIMTKQELVPYKDAAFRALNQLHQIGILHGQPSLSSILFDKTFNLDSLPPSNFNSGDIHVPHTYTSCSEDSSLIHTKKTALNQITQQTNIEKGMEQTKEEFRYVDAEFIDFDYALVFDNVSVPVGLSKEEIKKLEKEFMLFEENYFS